MLWCCGGGGVAVCVRVRVCVYHRVRLPEAAVTHGDFLLLLVSGCVCVRVRLCVCERELESSREDEFMCVYI